MDKQDFTKHLRKQYEEQTGVTPCIINVDVDKYRNKIPSYTEWLEEQVINSTIIEDFDFNNCKLSVDIDNLINKGVYIKEQ